MIHRIEDLTRDADNRVYLPCCDRWIHNRAARGSIACVCPFPGNLRVIIEKCPNRGNLVDYVAKKRCHQKDRRIFECVHFGDLCTIEQTSDREKRVCLRCDVVREIADGATS